MTGPPTTISSPYRFYGAKTRALGILLDLFPVMDDTIFVEPFGGSFVVSLNVNPRKAIINDLNEELVDFWLCVRGYPEDAPDTTFPLYKMFKTELASCIISGKYMEQLKALQAIETDPMRKIALNGAYFYIRNRLSWSGSDNITVATSPSGQELRSEFDFWHKWFVGRDIRIWNLDFEEVIKRVNANKNKCFMYVDPPYFEMGWGYKHDMVKAQHYALASLLKASPHPWVLSYDDSPEVREIYKEYKIYPVEWRYTNAPGYKTDGKSELIITNGVNGSIQPKENKRRSIFER